ncbi:nucleoid-associated protein [Mucilaginibacter sp. UYCu711]|uniref:nucleoid-associated protein n=1 Tax=Mucilaginibacter sp. UYCu711 TaxID=3156339 RepID=UPI003D1BCDE7
MEFKKFGSNLDVKGMVIHQLNKNAGDRNVGFKKATQVLNVGEKEKVFIGKLNDSYHKKSNPTYGIFAGINPDFKETLESYLSADHFYDFSVSAAEKYKVTLANTISSTGGFLIFTDFINTDTKNRYMLVLTINNKDGYVVSEADLTLQDIKNLDLGQVDVACMINLTRWKDIEAGADTDSKTYLSFVKGNKKVSYYFLTFIDCDNKTTSTESSKRLVNAIEAYATTKGYDRQSKIRLKNQIHDYCTDCMTKKKDIQLSAISALVDPDNINEFQEFAAGEEYGVSETIKGDKAQLKRIKYIMYKDDRYSVEFDAGLLGTDVIYNKEKNELTFKKVPEGLIKQLPS